MLRRTISQSEYYQLWSQLEQLSFAKPAAALRQLAIHHRYWRLHSSGSRLRNTSACTSFSVSLLSGPDGTCRVCFDSLRSMFHHLVQRHWMHSAKHFKYDSTPSAVAMKAYVSPALPTCNYAFGLGEPLLLFADSRSSLSATPADSLVSATSGESVC